MSTDAGRLSASLIVDDHELIREGLVGAFAREDGDRGGRARSAPSPRPSRPTTRDRPDVIVTDLQLEDGTGLDIIRQIRQTDEKIGLVVVTMHSGDDQIFAAMEAGASAFVGKDAPSTEVVRAARHAAVSPRSFLCTGLAGAMMRRMSAESTRLSTREHDVLLLLADGDNAAAIGAEALHERVDGEVPHRPHLPEARGQQPRPGPGHRDADRAALQRPAPRGLRRTATRTPVRCFSAISSRGSSSGHGPNGLGGIESIARSARRRMRDIIESGGLRPSRLSTVKVTHLS